VADVRSIARPRRDENPARVKEFKTVSARAKKHLFDDRHTATGHLYLKLLLCHPNNRRQKHGSALVDWGLRHAASKGMHTTLFASPMGEKLYKRLRFRKVDNVKVQVPGEEDFLTMPAMEYPSDSNNDYEPPMMNKRRQVTW
jgi:hypothetical protein